MPPDAYTLRSLTELEALFYRELLAPLRHFAASRQHDPAQSHETKLLAQRFRKDIARYGYVLTQGGAMMQIEPDILDTKLDAAHQAIVYLDMQVLNRV